MPKIIICFIACCIAWTGLTAQETVQSPSDFLPHKLGEQFTYHHQLVAYYEHAAANSDRVQLSTYGQTNEDRPLLMAVVSTPENLENLETIMAWNQWQAGFQQGQPVMEQEYSIVWLSFGVHGNEAGATTSALQVLYELTRKDRADVQEWLENTIVIMDPSLNPDGYSRYTNWYRSVANLWADPTVASREHREPWPAGRVNHYYFDLNRDWAWGTQVESQQRMVQYQQWLPHIHVDFHEQFPSDHYYFAPAARPYHHHITTWQSDFQVTIGENNAKYFDQEGWLYFTKEVFDLLYPSYGDTYPIFNGAIGMTYEQAGHGIAGRAIKMENEDTLVLQDRIDHHTAAALSTIEVAAGNVAQINAEFRKFYNQSKNNPPGPYKTFIVKGENSPAKLKALTKLLDMHRISYKKAGIARRTSGVDYTDLTQKMVEVVSTDLIISTNQPKGLFIQVLFEPEPELEDSLTYDITAWALPYAYGLEAYASLDQFEGREDWTFDPVQSANTGAYAYAHTWESVADAKFLGSAQRAGIKARVSDGAITIEGKKFPAGTIVYTRADNRKLQGWDKTLTDLAKEAGQALTALNTGFADAGHDLGSSSMRFLKQPKILLVSGEKTNPNSFGHAWHYFEQVLGYPVSIQDADRISSTSLADYNVLVLPDGRFSWGNDELDVLKTWVQEGGKVIALGAAVRNFSGKSGFQLNSQNIGSGEIESTEDLIPYADRNRNFLNGFIPGAIFGLKLDNTHPLGYGLGETYFSMKTSASAYGLMDRGWNVGVIQEDPFKVGFAGMDAVQNLENSMVIGVEPTGRGSFIYLADNPLFRGFWYQGHLLMASALFLN